MIVLINGSFGIGKTTVARLLRGHFSGSVLYDPEWAGLLLRHPARLLKFEGSATDDFQDAQRFTSTRISVNRLKLSSAYLKKLRETSLPAFWSAAARRRFSIQLRLSK
jgi:hypothetical protein